MQRYIVLLLATIIGAGASWGATKKTARLPEDALAEARQAFENYEPSEARELYDEYEALMKKKKKALPDSLDEELERLVIMENMMSRVEQIVIVDSIVVDADGFFRHYRLSPEAGRLLPGETLRMHDVEMAFVPQNNAQFFYAREDSTGYFALMSADILDDGTVDRPAPLQGENLAGGGNAEYPFMLTDGMTLYYANDGDESLGGYDIFMTRRDDDGSFLNPQNIGMPYNSPYDDYLLAIDENTGIGWWATDRNQIPGKLTIYVFVPSETRVNVAPDDPNIAAMARIDNIELTHRGKDVSEYKARIEAIDTSRRSAMTSTPDFELPIGSTSRIYRSLSDFRSRSARSAMEKALNARTEIARTESRLAQLRADWASGNQSQGITILNLEQQLADARLSYRQYINRAISDELAALQK